MKTLTPARIQKVTSALHTYSLACCKQYGARVRRQSMKISVSGKLFSFRRNTGMPTLGTIKNALRYAAVQASVTEFAITVGSGGTKYIVASSYAEAVRMAA